MHTILLAFGERVRNEYLPPEELARLETFATWDWFPCEGGNIQTASDDPDAIAGLAERLPGYEAVILCHGAPRITADMLDASPGLRFIGELEGDRFAARIDLEAAWERGVRTVDTTNASSYPVAEWALGLTLIALRNAGTQFRSLIAGEPRDRNLSPYGGFLTGKRVGLIGCGNMGRRLIEFLRPFHVDIWVHDPYIPREMPEALEVTATSMNNIFARCDVVICLAPLTPGTRGMIGREQLDLLRPDTAFINVSRGAVVDSDALIARLERGDIMAGLDVFDPEPIPPDSEILKLPNVFATPHTASFLPRGRNPFFALMVDELRRFFDGHETRFDLTPRSLANRRGDNSNT